MVADDIPISGETDQRFAPVRTAFAANFENGDDLGACFAVCIDGDLVVDLRGGHTNRKREQAWSEETLACVYSTGKAVCALLIAFEAARGAIDYEAPVAQYWPEFAAAGKERVTVAEALSHQAGLCGFPEQMDPADWLNWDLICARLAAMAPLWEPATASGYHPQTYGFIAGELLRRVTGKTVGALLSHHRDQTGAEIFCGMESLEAARTAQMPKPPRAPDLGQMNAFKEAAFLKPWSAPARVSREAWLAAEMPASNMHADARSLARFLTPFVTDDARLDAAAKEAALRDRINGSDLVLPFDLTWAAGVMRNTAGHFGPSETAFGHAGFGGSCVVFDPAHRMTLAYVMNKMSPHLVGDPRALRLIDAVYACL